MKQKEGGRTMGPTVAFVYQKGWGGEDTQTVSPNQKVAVGRVGYGGGGHMLPHAFADRQSSHALKDVLYIFETFSLLPRFQCSINASTFSPQSLEKKKNVLINYGRE